MAIAKFTFDSSRANKRIQKLSTKLKNQSSVMRKVGEEELKKTQYRITNSKTSPNGIPWQAWSYSTLKQRQREGTAGRGLLYRTGALLKSLKLSVTRKGFSISTGVEYAKYLQEGTPNMPARPFLESGQGTKSLRSRIAKAIKKHLRV